MTKIIAVFEDDRKGGAESALCEICDKMKLAGINVELVALKCKSDDNDRICMDFYVSAKKSSFGLFKLAFLMMCGQIERPSHIMFNGRTSFFFSPLFSYMTNVIYRETNLVKDLFFLRRYIMRFVDKLIITNPSMSLTLGSRDQKKVYLINRLNRQAVTINRNEQAARNKYFFVGRNSAQKNFDLFSEFVTAENSAIFAEVYGRGYETMMSNDRIRYHGFKDWTKNLSGHEILILTSKFEGTPNVVLEAINNRIGVILPKKIYDDCQMATLFHYNYLQYFDIYSVESIKEASSMLRNIMHTEQPVLIIHDYSFNDIEDLCDDLQ